MEPRVCALHLACETDPVPCQLCCSIDVRFLSLNQYKHMAHLRANRDLEDKPMLLEVNMIRWEPCDVTLDEHAQHF